MKKTKRPKGIPGEGYDVATHLEAERRLLASLQARVEETEGNIARLEGLEREEKSGTISAEL